MVVAIDLCLFFLEFVGFSCSLSVCLSFFLLVGLVGALSLRNCGRRRSRLFVLFSVGFHCPFSVGPFDFCWYFLFVSLSVLFFWPNVIRLWLLFSLFEWSLLFCFVFFAFWRVGWK